MRNDDVGADTSDVLISIKMDSLIKIWVQNIANGECMAASPRVTPNPPGTPVQNSDFDVWTV